MKLTARYLKPFWALVLLCVLLLFGQAVSELSLPNLMSDLVNTGIQQGGLTAEAPKAMSKQAQTLLLYFCNEEDRETLLGHYYTIEPESSEAQRISKDYPMARKKTVCVQREGLDEEAKQALDAAYGRASYGFLLYMQEASASGELAQLTPQTDLDNDSSDAAQPGEDGPSRPMPDIFNFPILDPSTLVPDNGNAGNAGNEISGPASDPNLQLWLEQNGGGDSNYYTNSDGNLVPYDPPSVASTSDLQLYEPEIGFMSDMGEIEEVEDSPLIPETKPEYNEPEYNEEEPEKKPSSRFDLTEAGGLAKVSAERLYQLLPLLALVPQSSLDHAVALAGESSEQMASQVGVRLTRIFYTELGVDTAPIQSAYIWRTGLKMLGVALLGALAAILVGLISSRVATAVGRNLRHDLFVKVMSMNGPELDKASIASLITRMTNDVQQVGMMTVMGLRLFSYPLIMSAGGIMMAVKKSVSMSWLVAVAVLVMLGLVAIAMALALPKFKALQSMMDKLNRISREHLSGMMVVRAFGNQRFEEERFREANWDFTRTNRFVQRVMAGMMPAMMLVMNLSTLVIMWVGGHAIAGSTLQIGDMMAFIQYAMQIIASFLMLAVMFVMLPRAAVSAVRIGEVLDMPLEIEDPISAMWPEKVEGVLEFKDVSFRYSDAERDVLEHISFTVRPGETTAIIGATGAGKSTLVNLIPRFYDVTGGQITLDGHDIRSYKQQDLRAAIGYVPQKALLFSGSIQENLRYGKEDADEESLLEALEIAQAKDFVEDLEKGLDASMAQGGANVSGGQRQRLSMARALVRKAPIYIFDDSFSALDFKTEAALRRALVPYTKDSSVLIVAQRVSTVLHAQQILVLDEGKLVGKGTHKELLAACPQYREIAESQLQKEELA